MTSQRPRPLLVSNSARAAGGVLAALATALVVVLASLPASARPGLELLIVEGNDQRVARGSAASNAASFAPLRLIATSLENPAAGMRVTFSCAAPAGVTCSLANTQSTPMTVITNGAGIATLADPSGTIGIFSAGGTGTLTVTASAPGFGSATFRETVVAP